MGAGARLNPGGAAAQAVGLKTGDLPDLTIKEVKVYVVDPGQPGTAVTNAGWMAVARSHAATGIRTGATRAGWSSPHGRGKTGPSSQRRA
ncbi:hypothetical protein [Paludibaculum fermentans]|uniref:Uncharacterized protein n=1 Tax=Paludibaculum fermentans TaxID=1473598 RepID=A0A7S7SJ41_PALFE|nr:hypothetical protein [Paludibaculum fermentans]QOY87667.1 hypothetical protein IRI77_33775 [Paludibaculum fermentans]